MSRNAALAAGLALSLWPSLPARAVRPILLPAPEFSKGLTWINSEEFSLERLRGRRVVVACFLSVSSLNSLRALPRLEDWWRRYSQDGLMVIGIHTPDLEFEKDPAAVRAELKRLGATFPVALDNDRGLWKAYQNEGWPALYLIDHQGRIVFDRLGEGGYREFEGEILAALKSFNGYSPDNGARAANPPAAECGKTTAPLYIGARRSQPIALRQPRERGGMIVSSRDGEVAYLGSWTLEPEAVRSAKKGRRLSDFLRLIYRGAAAAAILRGSSQGPLRVFLKQDDMWLHSRNAGPDVRWDKSDRSFVAVSEPRFYDLTRNPNDDEHELKFYPEQAGAEVYGFDFPNQCQSPYPYR